MKAYRENRNTAPPIFNLGARWRGGGGFQGPGTEHQGKNLIVLCVYVCVGSTAGLNALEKRKMP